MAFSWMSFGHGDLIPPIICRTCEGLVNFGTHRLINYLNNFRLKLNPVVVVSGFRFLGIWESLYKGLKSRARVTFFVVVYNDWFTFVSPVLQLMVIVCWRRQTSDRVPRVLPQSIQLGTSQTISEPNCEEVSHRIEQGRTSAKPEGGRKSGAAGLCRGEITRKWRQKDAKSGRTVWKMEKCKVKPIPRAILTRRPDDGGSKYFWNVGVKVLYCKMKALHWYVTAER